MSELVSGQAGSRFINVLSLLSSRLGESSRFTVAANLLQRDISSLRESVSQEVPASTSTLEHPEVRASVESLLRVLGEDAFVERHGQVRPRSTSVNMQVNGVSLQSSPASPAALGSLIALPPTDRFSLNDAGEDEKCAICLESLAESRLLQMPCNKMHRFHEDCLGDWLKLGDYCPLCRTRLQDPAFEDDSLPAEDEDGDELLCVDT